MRLPKTSSGGGAAVSRSSTAPLPTGRKYVQVHLLNGAKLYLAVDVKCRVGEVLDCALRHACVEDARPFGLATQDGAEWRFLDHADRLATHAPKSWSASVGWGTDLLGNPSVIVHLRVRIYFDYVRLISCPNALINYYQQLRANVLIRWSDDDTVTEPRWWEVAALALQADFGDCSPAIAACAYFRPDHYFPLHLLNARGVNYVKCNAPLMHAELAGMDRGEARVRFCREVSRAPAAVNRHLYGLRRRKTDQTDTATLGISTRGLELFDAPPERAAAADAPRLRAPLHWPNIGRLAFSKRKFTVAAVDERADVLYASTAEKAQYLLRFCRAVHQQAMALKADFADAAKREQREQRLWRESYIYSGENEMELLTVGAPRESVVSAASSNTTSGIVSDRQHPHDDSEEDGYLDSPASAGSSPAAADADQLGRLAADADKRISARIERLIGDSPRPTAPLLGVHVRDSSVDIDDLRRRTLSDYRPPTPKPADDERVGNLGGSLATVQSGVNHSVPRRPPAADSADTKRYRVVKAQRSVEGSDGEVVEANARTVVSVGAPRRRAPPPPPLPTDVPPFRKVSQPSQSVGRALTTATAAEERARSAPMAPAERAWLSLLNLNTPTPIVAPPAYDEALRKKFGVKPSPRWQTTGSIDPAVLALLPAPTVQPATSEPHLLHLAAEAYLQHSAMSLAASRRLASSPPPYVAAAATRPATLRANAGVVAKRLARATARATPPSADAAGPRAGAIYRVRSMPDYADSVALRSHFATNSNAASVSSTRNSFDSPQNPPPYGRAVGNLLSARERRPSSSVGGDLSTAADAPIEPLDLDRLRSVLKQQKQNVPFMHALCEDAAAAAADDSERPVSWHDESPADFYLTQPLPPPSPLFSAAAPRPRTTAPAATAVAAAVRPPPPYPSSSTPNLSLLQELSIRPPPAYPPPTCRAEPRNRLTESSLNQFCFGMR